MPSTSRIQLVVLVATVALAPVATATAAPAAPRAAVAPVGAVAVPPVTELPDGTEGGLVLSPRRDVAAIKRMQSRAAADVAAAGAPAATEPVSGYRTTDGLHLRRVSAPYRPYDDKPVQPLPGTAAALPTQVTTTSGATVTHPVRLAQASFLYANSYRVTRNRAYLDAAVKTAEKLVAIRVDVDGAWFYPYDFDFAVHGDTTQTLKAPWYSAMAQGYALTAFVRLAEYTGEPRWTTAARATFEAMTLAPAKDRPWVTWVDGDRNLWLEEYPRPGVTDSERVLNGHGFAVYGLYDYWQLTGDRRAVALISGGVATQTNLVLSEFRVPNYASHYSLHHEVNSITYHLVHGEQFVMMYRLTDQALFAQAATLYRADFPSRGTAGTVLLTPKARTAFLLDANRKVTQTRAVAFARDTSAPGDRRERLPDGRIMLRISAGAYKGWWFTESYGSAWYAGPKEVHEYRPRPLTLRLPAGTYTGYRYDASGRRVGSRTLRLTAARTLTVPRTAVVDTRNAFSTGTGLPFAGYWVPFTPRMQFLP